VFVRTASLPVSKCMIAPTPDGGATTNRAVREPDDCHVDVRRQPATQRLMELAGRFNAAAGKLHIRRARSAVMRSRRGSS